MTTAIPSVFKLDRDTYAEAIHGTTGKVYETGTLAVGTECELERTYTEETFDGPEAWAVVLVKAEGTTFRHRVPLANILLPVEAGRCRVCGQHVEQPTEPVTVSGWYSGHRFQLVDRLAKLVDVRCSHHRTEA